ncbi:WD40 repeat domain-containing protein [Leptothoe sp. LEGE 181152]|nr:WD40 repeat domain-containing protein [Leptothoe sp. LEGE 181152]
MATQILTQLSTQSLQVGDGHDQFEVMVNNLSNRFATFTLELSAPGIRPNASPDWYRLTPDISAKIPAGDQANFIVNLLALPPIAGGFTGKMKLNVNVTCLELGEKDRQSINLEVKGPGSIPLEISMATTEFQGKPGELIDIPVVIKNCQRNTANLQVELTGLNQNWLIDGHKRRLQLPPQGRSELLFICQLPDLSEAIHGDYGFQVEARQIQAQPVQQAATLTVLPVGSLLFDCDLATVNPKLHKDPREMDEVDDVELWEVRSHLPSSPTHNPRSRSTKASKSKTYRITLDNASNVVQSVRLNINRIDIPWFKRLQSFLRRTVPTPARTTPHCLHLRPSQVDLKPGEVTTLALNIKPKVPWWGWRRRQQFQLHPQLQETIVDPPEHQIRLAVPPRVPFWLQCLGLLLMALGLRWFYQHLSDHKGPVNSVQFDGQASMVISGSNDNTIGRWQLFRQLRKSQLQRLNKLPPNKAMQEKAVRVVHYRPRNNNILAAGLENGEIQLWDLLAETNKPMVFQPDDRVFDLQFSADSRSLFSAHGSGLVLRWYLPDLDNRPRLSTPAQQQQFNFAVQAMAPTSLAPEQGILFNKTPAPEDPLALVIGGRRNQLKLWDPQTDQISSIPYATGQEDNYITSLDTANNKPTRLAVADNQGRISLWNLNQCWTDNANCSPTDQWTDGHQERPVNAIALTQDACYLVSGGADGRVILWRLNPSGLVMDKKQIAKFSKPINSVDIAQKENTLAIVSGSDTHQVNLRQTKADNPACP